MPAVDHYHLGIMLHRKGDDINNVPVTHESIQMMITEPEGTTVMEGIATFGWPYLANLCWPIGSIFLSVVSTNPATLLGVGTWVAFATGRMMVGLNAGDPDFDTVEETGGSKTHTLTVAQLPAHTHTQNAHQHAMTNLRGAGTGSATTTASGVADGPDTSSTPTTLVTSPATAVNQNTGGGAAHSVMNPYVVVYCWKRTA